CLFRDPTHTGNRTTDGARRAVAPGTLADSAARTHSPGLWSRVRIGRSVRRRAAAAKSVVPDRISRPADIGVDHVVSHCDRDHRVPVAGVAGYAPQPRHRTAI